MDLDVGQTAERGDVNALSRDEEAWRSDRESRARIIIYSMRAIMRAVVEDVDIGVGVDRQSLRIKAY